MHVEVALRCLLKKILKTVNAKVILNASPCTGQLVRLSMLNLMDHHGVASQPLGVNWLRSPWK